MRANQKPVITKELLGKNLFLENLQIHVNKIVLQGKYISDGDGHILLAEQDFEKDTYSRVYNDSERRLKMMALSSRAKELLMFVIYETEIGLDHIWINRVRYMKENKVKAYNTYIEALKELIRQGYLAATAIHSVYWINPRLFFNGSRINAFPDKVVRK